MLNHDLVIDLCRTAGLTPAGVAYVQRVRATEPARRVGGTRFLSVASRFPSTKMARSIQAESRTGEYPLVLSLELEDDVLEYYDQPEPITLRRCRNGRNRVDPYTPDFLVLRHDAIEVIEVKPYREVLKQAEAHPDEWGKRNGDWIHLPVAEHFTPLGIRYRVHLAEDISPVRAANLGLLLSAKESPTPVNDEVAWARAQAMLSSGKPVTLHDLAETLRLPDVSAVLRWVVQGKVHVADSAQLLAETRTARVFGTSKARDAFAMALNIDKRDQQADGGRLPPTRTALTERQTEQALQRYKETFAALAAGKVSRQQRRYLREYRLAEAHGTDLLAPFVPRFDRRGNRKPRITPEQLRLVCDAIELNYATPARRSARWVHSGISWGDVPPVSYTTFCLQLKTYEKSQLAGRRSGHRASMTLRPPTLPADRSLMPTAAWELVHIDHTPLDEKVWVQSGLQEVLERPHISIAIDAWSKCVVAFWLSFTAPSRATLLALVRDCVRRHGRLARGWISDHGAEFGSVAWEGFCAAHSCTKFERPVGFPRAGSEIENLFGQLNKGLIHQLDGNMRNDQDSRAASSSHKSQATARFTLEQLYSRIDAYLFELYNQTSHGPNLFAPSANLEQSVADLGRLAGIRQAFDYAFRVDTALPSKRERHIIDSRRGIRVGERAYWHPALGEPSNDRKRVEVRHEPFDSSVVYAYVGGAWLTCVDSRHSKLECVDEFSRWAQAALDMNGRARANAARRLANERFVRSLADRQAAEDAERLASEQKPAPKSMPAASADPKAAEADAPSAFTFLMGSKRPPLLEADS